MGNRFRDTHRGGQVINPFFTAPYRTGRDMESLRDRRRGGHLGSPPTRRATAIEAQATGLAGRRGQRDQGHLLQISSRAENSFGVAIMNRMLTFNNQIGANTATTNTWLGLTDSDDPGLGATEANAAETTNWIWAGTTGGAGPGGQQRIEDTTGKRSRRQLLVQCQCRRHR